MKLFALIILLSALSCNKTQHELIRKMNIPDNAIWVGGADGGVWIKCNEGKVKLLFHCAIYHEITGEIWSVGKYRLKSNNREVESKNSRVPKPNFSDLSFESYDGSIIYLSNSYILVPD